jgi:poly(glycerol-phosphate) alpha-glucosyltransferase
VSADLVSADLVSADILPDAEYVVVGSRIALGLDGGFAVAVPAHVELLRRLGADPLMASLDGQSERAHAEQRQAFVDAGLLDCTERFRNLFDDLRSRPAWLETVGVPGEAEAGVAYREVQDAAGRAVVSLPVMVGEPPWQLRETAIVVHAGAGDRVVRGFPALYAAWLTSLADERRASLGDPDRTLVVVCESRQIGEALVGWRDPRVRLVHMVHNSHLEPPFDDPDGPVGAMWGRWLAAMPAFDAVLWPTAWQRAEVEARFGAHPASAVVPSPVDPVERVVPASVRDPRRVVMLGRLAAQKRVDRAIRAWPRVRAAVPDARLEIYGDGPLASELLALIDELGLGASVTLHGHTDDRAAVLDSAALMLVSTAFEGQGLSIAEALVRGLPVVSFDVRYGPRDLIAAGGILVPPGDVDALADAVVRVLVDYAHRAALSDAAVTAGRALTPDAVAPAFAAAIRGAVARPSRRAPRA